MQGKDVYEYLCVVQTSLALKSLDACGSIGALDPILDPEKLSPRPMPWHPHHLKCFILTRAGRYDARLWCTT